MINYGKHTLGKSDYYSVAKSLRGEHLTTGLTIKKFETELIKKFGGKYCTVVNNGTSALFVVGKALGWKKGDRILTTPLSFLATANCIVNNNAIPDFVDIETKTFTIDPNRIEDKVKKKELKLL